MSSEWIAPEELLVYQLVMYHKKFNANFSSYSLHYYAAHRNTISAKRMDYIVEQTVLARLKGEIPPPRTQGAEKCWNDPMSRTQRPNSL